MNPKPSGAQDKPAAPDRPAMGGWVRVDADHVIRGWVSNRLDRTERRLVEVQIDAVVIARARADRLEPMLVGADEGDSHYGFAVVVPAAFRDFELHTFSARTVGSDFHLKSKRTTFQIPPSPPPTLQIDACALHAIKGTMCGTSDDAPPTLELWSGDRRYADGVTVTWERPQDGKRRFIAQLLTLEPWAAYTDLRLCAAGMAEIGLAGEPLKPVMGVFPAVDASGHLSAALPPELWRFGEMKLRLYDARDQRALSVVDFGKDCTLCTPLPIAMATRTLIARLAQGEVELRASTMDVAPPAGRLTRNSNLNRWKDGTLEHWTLSEGARRDAGAAPEEFARPLGASSGSVVFESLDLGRQLLKQALHAAPLSRPMDATLLVRSVTEASVTLRLVDASGASLDSAELTLPPGKWTKTGATLQLDTPVDGLCFVLEANTQIERLDLAGLSLGARDFADPDFNIEDAFLFLNGLYIVFRSLGDDGEPRHLSIEGRLSPQTFRAMVPLLPGTDDGRFVACLDLADDAYLEISRTPDPPFEIWLDGRPCGVCALGQRGSLDRIDRWPPLRKAVEALSLGRPMELALLAAWPKQGDPAPKACASLACAAKFFRDRSTHLLIDGGAPPGAEPHYLVSDADLRHWAFSRHALFYPKSAPPKAEGVLGLTGFLFAGKVPRPCEDFSLVRFGPKGVARLATRRKSAIGRLDAGSPSLHAFLHRLAELDLERTGRLVLELDLPFPDRPSPAPPARESWGPGEEGHARLAVVTPVSGEAFLSPHLLDQQSATPAGTAWVIVNDRPEQEANLRHFLGANTVFVSRRTILLKNIEPRGFVRSCNIGASNIDSEYILFLEQDVFIANFSPIQAAMLHMDETPEVAACAFTTLYPDGERYFGDEGLFRYKSFDGLQRLDALCAPAQGDGHASAPAEMARVSDIAFSGCLLVRRAAFDELLLDEDYADGFFAFHDLRLRMQGRGGRMLSWRTNQVFKIGRGDPFGASKAEERAQRLLSDALFTRRWTTPAATKDQP